MKQTPPPDQNSKLIMKKSKFRQAAGFTLIELIVVMVVVGILSGIVAMFIRHPMDAYVTTSRRATLVDAGNTALQRITGEVQGALPNSLRVTVSGGITYLEFLPVQDGGRYRVDTTAAGSGDTLDFTSGSDASFDVLGPLVTTADGQALVVYNLGTDADTDAWQGGNRRTVVSPFGSVSNLTFTATGTPFPLESPGNRFYLIGAPITYLCNPTSHQLLRVTGYALQATQPTSFGTATPRLLASEVASCSLIYDAGAGQGLGQLTLRLQLTRDGETVTLYREMAVNNDA